MSSDGAQLTMKKQSETWLAMLILLNLPAEICVKSGQTIICFATPGPHPPGNLESSAYTVFKEMMMASEGIWTWDAVDLSYFINRAYLCMALGDMLGSAKLSGMAGHSAIYGDQFSMVKGARSSREKGAKSQYYPLSSPENHIYNPDWPYYNLDNLPMHDTATYWETITKLIEATSAATCTVITRQTGVSRMSLFAASPTFLHPCFFPLDPFHLFYKNCMAWLWDLWTIASSDSEQIHINADKAHKFGRLLTEAMATLPPAFCSPIRDPFLKCQIQYKIYEWMALLHWYILPIGIELGLNPALLQNFSDFVEIIEISMTIQGRTTEELANLHNLIKKFLEGFEKLYIGKDPAKVSHFRLCLFQLIHIPTHIEWYGSVRIGSQATVERAIGEMGHKVHSRKAPFANLANIIYERERAKLLRLYYPSLELRPSQSSTQSRPELFTKIHILSDPHGFCNPRGSRVRVQVQVTNFGPATIPVPMHGYMGMGTGIIA